MDVLAYSAFNRRAELDAQVTAKEAQLETLRQCVQTVQAQANARTSAANWLQTGEYAMLCCPHKFGDYETLIENNEFETTGGDFFIRKYLDEILAQDDKIDTLILACTHYPILIKKITSFLPKGVRVVSQGDLVASKLEDYLFRHPQISERLTKKANLEVLTTENSDSFDAVASGFYSHKIHSKTVQF